jgi:hypothetical protein
VRSRARARSGRAALLLVIVASLLLATEVPVSAAAAGIPVVPLPLARWFVSNLTGAEVDPGGGGTISYTVGNPFANVSISSVVLTLQVYAFNAYPGNATSTVAVASAPVLVTATASGLSVNQSIGTIREGTTVSGSVTVESSATTPSGAYAVRTALRFDVGASDYLLESRGWFTAAQWADATAGPNGTVTLNVSVLGVSGVSPETSILVTSSDLTTAIWAVFGASLVLIGLGAWLYFRPPKSRSGVRNVPVEIQAPSALGTKRTSEGD